MEKSVNKYTTALKAVVVVSFSVFLFVGCAGMQTSHVRPAPDFKVGLMGGGEASLAQFKGKPLVLNLGASWCPHCVHELPELIEADKEYKGKIGFLVVFIKSDMEEIDALIEDNGLEFMVGHDKEAGIGKAFGVKGIPVTFFIDSNGMIVDEYLGSITGARLKGNIDKLLAAPVAKGK